jgi:hypothetical protein
LSRNHHQGNRHRMNMPIRLAGAAAITASVFYRSFS